MKEFIAKIAWKIFLWASNETEAGFIFKIAQETDDYM